ncbi:MAG: hypothetical protein Crog4KO_06290 [Crocinitomicaceae bacterium]
MTVSVAELHAQDCPDRCDVTIPNVLYTNADCFDCHYLEIQSNCDFVRFHLIVFNRWGELVFESEDRREKFDGTEVKEGTYTLQVEVKFCNGQEVKRSGHVNVIK